MSLSPRAADYLEFIRTHIKAFGFTPTYEAICSGMDIKSKSTVAKWVTALEREGCIRRLPGRANGIEVIPDADHHAPQCQCAPCETERYKARLMLVQAIQIEAPAKVAMCCVSNIKPLDHATRLYWKHGFPISMRPKRQALG